GPLFKDSAKELIRIIQIVPSIYNPVLPGTTILPAAAEPFQSRAGGKKTKIREIEGAGADAEL
ncbi:MAG: hypothetical protein LBG25_00965, partial [Spirochaetaceae bacterium]|nr:hypothetical protein [Spirochaetaceae bacterium]